MNYTIDTLLTVTHMSLIAAKTLFYFNEVG